MSMPIHPSALPEGTEFAPTAPTGSAESTGPAGPSFARVLSGQLDRSEPDTGRRGAGEPSSRQGDEAARPIAETPTDHDRASRPEPAGQPGETEGLFRPFGEASLTLLSAWAGQPSTVDLGGFLLTDGLDPTALETAPASVRAGLAGRIAAGLTDQGGVQTLHLSLEPEHLGRVEVKLQVRGAHLTVRITAAGPEAEAALKENVRDLADAIGEKAARFQSVDVRVEGKSSNDTDPAKRQAAGQEQEPDAGQDGNRSEEETQARDDDPGAAAHEPGPDHRAEEG